MQTLNNELPTLVALAVMAVHIFSRAGEAAEPDVGPGTLSAEIMGALKTLDSTFVFLSLRHHYYEDGNIICHWNNPKASAYLVHFNICANTYFFIFITKGVIDFKYVTLFSDSHSASTEGKDFGKRTFHPSAPQSHRNP